MRFKLISAFSAIATLLVVFNGKINAQSTLKPGFSPKEYKDLMHISAQFGDSIYRVGLDVPSEYAFVYRSKTMGLDNMWDLYTGPNKTIIISLRGTTAKPESWLENFYAAMVPAKGEIQIAENKTFTYKMAENPKAAIHVGWLLGTAFLWQDIEPKVDSLYKKGFKNLLLVGHSQGGSIGFLMAAHINMLIKDGKLPNDIRLKSYLSAAPKPGNAYFAYEFENTNQQGWAFNVINSVDWVPEVPVSIQTLDDFNPTNPFKDAKSIAKKQKFPKNILLKRAVNKLDRPNRKAVKNYQKYLGNFVSKEVAKNIVGYKAPSYVNSNHYVRTGTSIVLIPDENYFTVYPLESDMIFKHHFHYPYLMLLENAYPEIYKEKNKDLSGEWKLSFIEGLKPGSLQKIENLPTVNFDTESGIINGYSGCNSYSGNFNFTKNGLEIGKNIGMTRMYCEGSIEGLFIESLSKVVNYELGFKELVLLDNNNEVILRFIKP